LGQFVEGVGINLLQQKKNKQQTNKKTKKKKKVRTLKNKNREAERAMIVMLRGFFVGRFWSCCIVVVRGPFCGACDNSNYGGKALFSGFIIIVLYNAPTVYIILLLGSQ